MRELTDITVDTRDSINAMLKLIAWRSNRT